MTEHKSNQVADSPPEVDAAPVLPKQHPKAPSQTRVHRLMVGDGVEFMAEITNGERAKLRDLTLDKDSDPDAIVLTKLEGKIVAITNDVGTYILCDFGDDGKRELTEDEVRRTGA